MKSIQGRARLATIMLGLVAIVSAAAAWTDVEMVVFLGDILQEKDVDIEAAENLDTWVLRVVIAQVTLAVLGLASFIAWFYAAHKNLERAGMEDLDHTSKWAVWGFFVPILNLIRPYKVMKEVWRGSLFLTGEAEEEDWKEIKEGGIVEGWWTMFVLSVIAGRISARMTSDSIDAARLTLESMVSFVANFLDIPVAILGIILIRSVTRLQERALEHQRATNWRSST